MEKIFRIKEKNTDNKELEEAQYVIWRNNFKIISKYILNYLESKKVRNNETLQISS